MIIYKNIDLDLLMSTYGLTLDELPPVVFSPYIQSILDDQIIQNEYGVGLCHSYIPYKEPEGYGQSYYDDDMNHFHVTDICSNDKDAFTMALYATFALAKKFELLKINNIRIWLTFQSKEMRVNWEKYHGIYENENDCHISDRISFHRKVPGEVVVSENFPGNIEYMAILVIDIS